MSKTQVQFKDLPDNQTIFVVGMGDYFNEGEWPDIRETKKQFAKDNLTFPLRRRNTPTTLPLMITWVVQEMVKRALSSSPSGTIHFVW